MPARTSFVRPAGGAANRAIITGSQPRLPVIADRGSLRHGYTPPASHSAGEGYRQPGGHGSAPPAQRGELTRGRAAGGARSSGGNYADRGGGRGGAYSGGGARNNGGGGSFQRGGAATAPAGGGGGAHAGGGGGHR